MFTQRQISAFQEVMRSGSLTSAAEYLNTSQPGVSRLVKDLEANLGFLLFTRHGSRIVPTRAAHDLAEVVERSFIGLNYIAEVADRIRVGANANLSIAASPAFAATLIAEAISDLQRVFDLSTINTIHITTLPVVRQIALRRAELGVTLLDHHTHDTDLVSTQKMTLYAISESQEEFFGSQFYTLEDLQEKSFVGFDESTVTGQLQNSLFSTLVKPPKVVFKSFLANVASALVLKGFGYAIVDPWTAKEHKSKGGGAIPFDNNHYLNVSCITPQGTQLSKVAQALVSAMDDRFESARSPNFI